MADFGQTDFGQTDFDLCLCVFVCVCVCLCVCLCVVCVCVCLVPPEPPFPGPPSRDRPSLGRPSPGQPKISLFFFPLPPQSSFLPSLGVFSLNFGRVFEGQNPQMCTFGLSGCRVKPRRFRGRRLAHDSPRTPNMHISGPRPSKTPPKFHGRTSREGRKERILRRDREKKSAKFWAPHPSGPPFGAPPFWAPPFWAPTLRAPPFWAPPFEPPPFSTHHINSKHTKKTKPKQLTPKNQNLYIQLKP